jgi:hypothetical protein
MQFQKTLIQPNISRNWTPAFAGVSEAFDVPF